jgi:hypothetical protein
MAGPNPDAEVFVRGHSDVLAEDGTGVSSPPSSPGRGLLGISNLSVFEFPIERFSIIRTWAALDLIIFIGHTYH